jgi:hypothetical protein
MLVTSGQRRRVDAHLRQCGDCRSERASLAQMADSRRRTALTCALRQSFTKRIDAMRPVTAFADRLTRLRVWRSVVSTVSGQAALVGETSLVDLLATGPLIAWLAGLLARLRVALMAAHRWVRAICVGGRRPWGDAGPRAAHVGSSHAAGTLDAVQPDRSPRGRDQPFGRPLHEDIEGRSRRGHPDGRPACFRTLRVSNAPSSGRLRRDRDPGGPRQHDHVPECSLALGPNAGGHHRDATPHQDFGGRVDLVPGRPRGAFRAESESGGDTGQSGRGGDPCSVGDPSSPATVLAPIPATEAARSAEPSDAPDSSAAIDWLRRGAPRKE